MQVILIAGSTQRLSRSAVLLDYVEKWLVQQRIEARQFRVIDFPAQDLLHAKENPVLSEFKNQLAQSDGVVLATPIYKASFSGVLKTLLDVLPPKALQYKVVLPLATGGTRAHLLALDYALNPVLNALKAGQILPGIFADDSQIRYATETSPVSLNPELIQRLTGSLQQFRTSLCAIKNLFVADEVEWTSEEING